MSSESKSVSKGQRGASTAGPRLWEAPGSIPSMEKATRFIKITRNKYRLLLLLFCLCFLLSKSHKHLLVLPWAVSLAAGGTKGFMACKEFLTGQRESLSHYNTFRAGWSRRFCSLSYQVWSPWQWRGCSFWTYQASRHSLFSLRAQLPLTHISSMLLELGFVSQRNSTGKCLRSTLYTLLKWIHTGGETRTEER